MNTRDMCRVAMAAATLCAIAPVTVPIGPVPISLATLGVYLIGVILGARKSIMTVVCYILLGAVGLPVFSGFGSGIQKLLGPTGGYLLGYIACAGAVGLASDLGAEGWVLSVAMLAGTVLCYGLGMTWFMLQTGMPIGKSLQLCVLPFLPGDAGKIVLSTIMAAKLKRRHAIKND